MDGLVKQIEAKRKGSVMDMSLETKEMASVEIIDADVNVAFYKSDWFTFLMLVLFSPVGIFLMWKFKKFSQLGRLLVTTFLVCVFLMVASYIAFICLVISAMYNAA